MGIFGGGGLFGSGAKTNSGNTSTINKNMTSADLIEDNSGFINRVSINEGQGAVVTMTDYGALESATNIIDKGINTVSDTVNDVLSVITGVSADNKAISEYAISEVASSSNSVLISAENFADDNAILTDSVISGNNALTAQFGADVAYLADASMTNNAILTDKVIDTADMLTTQHQESLNDFGRQLGDAQSMFSAEVGNLYSQGMSANNELTSQYMSSVEYLTGRTEEALLNFGLWTEGALDSALEVAGNVALDDSVEGIQNIFKYLSIAGAVIGAVYVFKGK